MKILDIKTVKKFNMLNFVELKIFKDNVYFVFQDKFIHFL